MLILHWLISKRFAEKQQWCSRASCSRVLSGPIKESSFKKVQETLRVVDQENMLHFFCDGCHWVPVIHHPQNTWTSTIPLQEFQYQFGISMPGAPSSLRSAGTNGKHPQNIKRDILRKLNQADTGQDVPWINSSTCYNYKFIQSFWVPFMRCCYLLIWCHWGPYHPHRSACSRWVWARLQTVAWAVSISLC